MNIQTALQTIIDQAVESKPDSTIRYAASYAISAKRMKVGSEAFRSNLLYIKSNIVYWRGPVAKDAKAAIDNELSKQYSHLIVGRQPYPTTQPYLEIQVGFFYDYTPERRCIPIGLPTRVGVDLVANHKVYCIEICRLDSLISIYLHRDMQIMSMC